MKNGMIMCYIIKTFYLYTATENQRKGVFEITVNVVSLVTRRPEYSQITKKPCKEDGIQTLLGVPLHKMGDKGWAELYVFLMSTSVTSKLALPPYLCTAHK